ncbi:MAG TPA: TrmO family methyltransferase [Terriglobales bacterium]|nr:TrmO family methyltransferase [Terriglobales bacterium]
MVAQTTQQTAGRRRSFRVRAIGYVRTSYRLPEETPAQAPLNPDERGLLVVYPRYAPALAGVADFEYVQLITLLDRVPERLPDGPGQLVQVPFMLQQTGEAVGVFASRFPVRPNRLGLSLVRVERVRGRRVEFSGVDMLDRTPVLDVKPWEQHLDIPGWPSRSVDSIRGGWYQRARHLGARGQLAGRFSLERAGLLRPQSEEEEVS